MSEAYVLKFNQKSFNRGVEDAITLRPLRDAMSEAFGKGSSSLTSKGLAASSKSNFSVRAHSGKPSVKK